MYDVKCAELAMAFLDDEPAHRQTPEHRAALAQRIQDAIEEYFADLDLDMRAPALAKAPA